MGVKAGILMKGLKLQPQSGGLSLGLASLLPQAWVSSQIPGIYMIPVVCEPLAGRYQG